MEKSQAKALVAYLVAAFRPSNWTDESQAVYVENLLDLDAAAGLEATRALARSVRWMPTIAEMRVETRERTPELLAIAAEASWSEEELQNARETGARVLAEYRERRPTTRAKTFEDLVAKAPPA